MSERGWLRLAAVPPYFILRSVEGLSVVEGITLEKFFYPISGGQGGGG